MHRPVKFIVKGATIHVATESRTIMEIALVVVDKGSSYVITIQDISNTPVAIMSFPVDFPADGLPVVVKFTQPKYMSDGIDIVPSGTPGEVHVWINFGNVTST